MFDKNKTKKGFSIGEVMVAAFILVFGIVSSMALTARSTNTIVDSRNATIASLLAQEGVELVRNVRDNNVTNQDCGTTGADRCTAFDSNTSSVNKFPIISTGIKKCSIGYTMKNKDNLNCTNPDIGQLYINEDDYSYTHISGANTLPEKSFKRLVFISYETTDGTALAVADTNKLVAEVTSVVVWGKGQIPANATNIENDCKIGGRCAFAQTKLTSWINYDE